MNIQLLTPKFNVSNNVEPSSNSTIRGSNHTGLNLNNSSMPNLQPLAKDTVSFGAATNKISDIVANKVEKDLPRLNRIATTYLDVLEAVAGKLKNEGVSFDREYCELNPVKSPDSYTSKIMRSGTFTVPDAIRGTMYLKDPYDLSILNDKILPEMKKRGYILANVEVPVGDLLGRGYIPNAAESKNLNITKKIPDLDIRLQDASENINALSPELRYSIGKPQKSGYEDIQMRFVREFDKSSNPMQHELIILFGPNYSMAKHIESEKVYGNLRQFNELRLDFHEFADNSHAKKANRYLDLIQQMFRGKISEKLFLNAKNKDLYDLTEEIPINFSKSDIQLFDSYFGGLRDRLNSCYKDVAAKAKSSGLATKQINSDARHDRNLLTKIKDNLSETIEYFNYNDSLKTVAE